MYGSLFKIHNTDTLYYFIHKIFKSILYNIIHSIVHYIYNVIKFDEI